MSEVETTTQSRPTAEKDNGEVLHVVGRWQHFRDVALRQVPYALCGEWLAGNPDLAEPGANAPTCKPCAVRAGWSGRAWVPGHRHGSAR